MACDLIKCMRANVLAGVLTCVNLGSGREGVAAESMTALVGATSMRGMNMLRRLSQSR